MFVKQPEDAETISPFFRYFRRVKTHIQQLKVNKIL